MKDEVLLDRLAKPCEGMNFIGGFWTTHDYCGFTVADSLAPRLARCREPGTFMARRRARAKSNMGRLLILRSGAASFTPGPLTPPWIDVHVVHGRRLHAKFGVLAFAKERKVVYRGFVMSANLTRSGMMRNHEVVIVEEQKTQKTKKLPSQLVTALNALIDGIGAESHTHNDGLQTQLQALLPELNLPMAAEEPLRNVIHSLDSPRDLLKAAFEGCKAEYCQIVSPPFGADNSATPAKALIRYLKSDATTYLVTGRAADLKPCFSTKASETLDSGRRSVERWVVPEVTLVEGVATHRRLHAKLIALTQNGRARVLMGSANFSTSGLGLSKSANRELCVRMDFADENQFWDWDSTLGAKFYPGRFAPAPNDGGYEAVVTSPELVAVFRCASGQTGGQSTFSGTLILNWEGERIPGVLWYGDEMVDAVGEQAFTLQEEMSALFWECPSVGVIAVPIAFEPPYGERDFWTRVRPREPDPDKDMFVSWLDRFNRAKGEKEITNSPSSKQAITRRADDRYQVRLGQPLVRLARYREALKDLSNSQIQAIMKQLAEYDGANSNAMSYTLTSSELAVAAAVLNGAATRCEARADDPLLQAMSGWVESKMGGSQ